MNKDKIIRRGEIYWTNLEGHGSEQRGWRPVVVIQNNIGNKYSPTTIVALVTSEMKKYIPTHLGINIDDLPKSSTILCEQIMTIDKSRLGRRIGRLPSYLVDQLNEKLMISLGLVS